MDARRSWPAHGCVVSDAVTLQANLHARHAYTIHVVFVSRDSVPFKLLLSFLFLHGMGYPSKCPACRATLNEVSAVGELNVKTMQVDVRCPKCKAIFRVVIDRMCGKCGVKIPDETTDGLCAACRR